jgi:hypothetical protein
LIGVGEECEVAAGALVKEHVLFAFEDVDEDAFEHGFAVLEEGCGMLCEDGNAGL